LEARDLFKQPLAQDELQALLGGRPAATIFAARSPTVRKLGLDPTALSDEQLLELMAEHPTLIRRPLLGGGGDLIVGFDRQAYAERFDR
jgi:arsenate reductase-like glutaredoxin family protein